MKNHLLWFFAGIGVLLVIKYVLFGLTAWDKTFHPQRTEPATSPFLKPLLGIFG